MAVSDFSKLEAVVEKLLASLNSIKEEKVDLQRQIADKDLKIQELEKEIASLNDDQKKIGDRVSSLIGSIEDWEKGTGADQKEGNTSNPEDSPETQKPEGQLFNMGE